MDGACATVVVGGAAVVGGAVVVGTVVVVGSGRVVGGAVVTGRVLGGTVATTSPATADPGLWTTAGAPSLLRLRSPSGGSNAGRAG